MLQKSNSQYWDLTKGNMSCTFKPKCQYDVLTAAGNAFAVNEINPWIDLADNQCQYFGMKFACQNLSDGPQPNMHVDFVITYYFVLKYGR